MPAKHEPPQAPVSIDAANAWVWQGGRRLELASKTFTVLRYLIEQAGQLVTKEELHMANGRKGGHSCSKVLPPRWPSALK
jgi:DNA-binding response OmpR family regulator